MSELPRGQDRWGVVHGDFELDSMAWEEGGPIAYDFDEAALSWYAADIASAVRDLTDHTGLPATEHRARFDVFLDGYRSVSPYDDQDLGRLPLFAGLHAAASLVRITRALGEPARQEPEWLPELRDALTDMARAHRRLAIDIGRNVGRGIRWRCSTAAATTVEALLERSPRPASPPLPEPPGSWGEWRRSW